MAILLSGAIMAGTSDQIRRGRIIFSVGPCAAGFRRRFCGNDRGTHGMSAIVLPHGMEHNALAATRSQIS
jgi:hypothetical protein